MPAKPYVRKKRTVVPLKPEDVSTILQERIEPEMVESVNALIEKNFTGNSASFKQKELTEKYLEIKGLSGEEGEAEMKRVFAHHKMDFEDLFRSAGWKVDYTRPDYTENYYDPYFTFSKR